eukprot:TRINITY_DN7174_c0_g1_i1.p1 TRINITY_DN7174_c0_g1~~TRINITY_DN7174_c0_g1_i1.p1  ORF type:complete len:835 (+),score=290.02 TRINITY_DN7174_c0_g1_i1:145-2505(+)
MKELENARNQVRVAAFHMKRNLDVNKVMDALKNASDMIAELRTSKLSPKNYYQLYMTAFDELKALECWLYEERERHGKKMAELYETVQYAGNILPRLYLLVTVGAVYIKCHEAPTKDLLRDMVEMCKGVQHATRGLFLRNYLIEMTKDLLPSIASSTDGDVTDSVSFILTNFTEMNKLWVRLNQGPARDREKREAERKDLKILVGKNLARLSQLDTVNSEMYQSKILPRVVDQIIQCKDQLAQQYLMEIIIQVFPDEFHLATLEPLLKACCAVQPQVDVKVIVTCLIDRLAKFAASNPEGIPASVNVFKVFSLNIQQLVKGREVPCADYLALQTSLMNFCLKCYPNELGYIDDILEKCCAFLNGLANKEDIKRPQAVAQIMALLTQPLDAYKNILKVLDLKFYTPLANFLAYDKRKQVHLSILRNALQHQTVISMSEQVSTLLSFVQTLLRDLRDQPEASAIDKDDFAEEQNLVAATIHLFQNTDPEQLFAMYLTARQVFGQGGPYRVRHTLPPLIFCVLRLAMTQRQADADGIKQSPIVKKFFQFESETIKGLAKMNYSEMALRFYLQAAVTASECQCETHAYEFVSQAFTIYEEELADSAAQLSAITLIVGTIFTLTCFDADSYDTLITKTAKHANKLLRKQDQCRAVCLSSHLFWRDAAAQGAEPYHDGKRVLECLQKSLKIADQCNETSSNVGLFVEILNRYLYYFEKRNESVVVKFLSVLVALISTHIHNLEDAATNPDNAAIISFYNNTLGYIRWKKDTGNALYDGIDLGGSNGGTATLK